MHACCSGSLHCGVARRPSHHACGASDARSAGHGWLKCRGPHACCAGMPVRLDLAASPQWGRRRRERWGCRHTGTECGWGCTGMASRLWAGIQSPGGGRRARGAARRLPWSALARSRGAAAMGVGRCRARRLFCISGTRSHAGEQQRGCGTDVARGTPAGVARSARGCLQRDTQRRRRCSHQNPICNGTGHGSSLCTREGLCCSPRGLAGLHSATLCPRGGVAELQSTPSALTSVQACIQGARHRRRVVRLAQGVVSMPCGVWGDMEKCATVDSVYLVQSGVDCSRKQQWELAL
jgi:hypothetical protein